MNIELYIIASKPERNSFLKIETLFSQKEALARREEIWKEFADQGIELIKSGICYYDAEGDAIIHLERK